MQYLSQSSLSLAIIKIVFCFLQENPTYMGQQSLEGFDWSDCYEFLLWT